MVSPYKIRDSYKVRVLSLGSYVQFGITIPSFLIPEWSGVEVTIGKSGTNCLIIEKKNGETY